MWVVVLLIVTLALLHIFFVALPNSSLVFTCNYDFAELLYVSASSLHLLVDSINNSSSNVLCDRTLARRQHSSVRCWRWTRTSEPQLRRCSIIPGLKAWGWPSTRCVWKADPGHSRSIFCLTSHSAFKAV